MHSRTTSAANRDAELLPPDQTGSVTRFGLPAEVFGRAWTIDDVRTYLQIGRTQAYALVNEPTFPPRLQTGRSHRWNGLQVMAWLHHEDWRSATLHRPTGAGASTSDTPPPRLVPLGAPPGSSSTPSRPTRRGGSGRDAISPVAGDGPVVRRVIDPARVQRERRAARLDELFDNPERTAGAASADYNSRDAS